MKKLFALIIALALVLSLTACGRTINLKESPRGSSSSNPSSTTDSSSPTATSSVQTSSTTPASTDPKDDPNYVENGKKIHHPWDGEAGSVVFTKTSTNAVSNTSFGVKVTTWTQIAGGGDVYYIHPGWMGTLGTDHSFTIPTNKKVIPFMVEVTNNYSQQSELGFTTIVAPLGANTNNIHVLHETEDELLVSSQYTHQSTIKPGLSSTAVYGYVVVTDALPAQNAVVFGINVSIVEKTDTGAILQRFKYADGVFTSTY